MKLSDIKKLYSEKDSMHNWSHILKIKRNANILKLPYKKIDEELLDFLVKFHGLKYYVKIHSKKFPKKYVESLIRHSKSPKIIEEKIVYDANMLDNIGKEGIKKALFVGRLKGRSDKKTYEYLKKNIKKVRFHTKKGKEMGVKKLKEMINILEKIK